MRRKQATKLKPFGTTLPEDLIQEVKAEVLWMKATNPRVTIADVVEQALRDFIAGRCRKVQ